VIREFRQPVLMYHDLSDGHDRIPDEHRPYVLPATTFREQLRALADAGIGGARLDEILDPESATTDDRRRCVLTFDDGHASNRTLALPLLLGARFRATFFVTAGWIGREPYLSWNQVRELAAAGMEIGSHSMTHRPPATLTAAQLHSEMADSKKLLEDRLGQPVVSASSPTGFFNPLMIPIVRDIGYRALCTGRIAIWKKPGDSFRIPRLPVKADTGLVEYRRMVTGDGRLIARMRGEQMVRNGLKRALGVNGYERLRRWLLGRSAQKRS
jgi:peptidoglycan/xylan/chitin deacetylase (PgdA/CDA1 family)